MQVIEQGHTYHVDNLEGGVQEISFISKAPTSDTDPTLVTVQNGTTTEEVLSVLIDRMKFLNGRVPCEANEKIITSLESALTLLEQRTAERIERGVEGTQQA